MLSAALKLGKHALGRCAGFASAVKHPPNSCQSGVANTVSGTLTSGLSLTSTAISSFSR